MKILVWLSVLLFMICFSPLFSITNEDFYSQTEIFLINYFSDPNNAAEAKINASNSLLIAVDRNYPRLIKLLLELGVDVNTKNAQGISPLLWAVTKNNLSLVKTLLSYGADPNTQDNQGWTPLILASQNNNLSIVKILVSKGANINSVNFEGSNALFWAIRNGSLELVNYLVNQKTNIKHINTKNESVLHVASQYGKDEILELLLKKDSSLINSFDSFKLSPFLTAVQYSRYSCVKILFPYEKKLHPYKTLDKAILLAESLGNREMVDYLKSLNDEDTSSPQQIKEDHKTAPIPIIPTVEKIIEREYSSQSDSYSKFKDIPLDVQKRILDFLGILDTSTIKTVKISKRSIENGEDVWSGSVTYLDTNDNRIKNQIFSLTTSSD